MLWRWRLPQPTWKTASVPACLLWQNVTAIRLWELVALVLRKQLLLTQENFDLRNIYRSLPREGIICMTLVCGCSVRMHESRAIQN